MDATTPAVGTANTMPTLAFTAAAAVLGVVTLILIFKKVEVSSGHAIMMGAALALAALPYVAKFEWSKDGVKYEARMQAMQVAKAVEDVAQAQAKQNETVKQLTADLQIAAQNIQAFRTTAATGGLNGNFGDIPRLDPDAFKTLLERSQAIEDTNKMTLERLEQFQHRWSLAP